MMHNGSLASHQSASGPGDSSSIRDTNLTYIVPSVGSSAKKRQAANSHPESKVPRDPSLSDSQSEPPPPVRHNVGIDGAVCVAARQTSGGDGLATAAADTSGRSRRIGHTHVSARSKDYRSGSAWPASQPASRHTKIAYSTRKARTPR